MQLISDIVQNASMSDKKLIEMESSTMDRSILDSPMADSMELTSNDDIGAGAKDVMVIIPEPYLDREVNDQNSKIPVEVKELSDFPHTDNGNCVNNVDNACENTIKDNNCNKNNSQLLDEAKSGNANVDEMSAVDVDSSKQLNGDINSDLQQTSLSDDIDMPLASIDHISQKRQDIPSNNYSKDSEILNGDSEKVNCLDIDMNITNSVSIKTEDEDSENLIDDTNNSLCYVDKTDKVKIENLSNIDSTCIRNKPREVDMVTNTDQLTVAVPADIDELKENEVGVVLKSLKDDTFTSDIVELKKDGVESDPKNIPEENSKLNIVETKTDLTKSNEEKPTAGKVSEKEEALNKQLSDSIAINPSAIMDTLNLDSDDENDGKKVDEVKSALSKSNGTPEACVSVILDDDDDDIMLVDDKPKETESANNSKDHLEGVQNNATAPSLNDDPISDISKENGLSLQNDTLVKQENDIVLVSDDKAIVDTDNSKGKNDNAKSNEITVEGKDHPKPQIPPSEVDKIQDITSVDVASKVTTDAADVGKINLDGPLIPFDYKMIFKNSIAELSREELEDFCLYKIVEAIVARSNLSDVRLKLKMLQKNIEEWRKKVNDLTKQNKDLDTVVKAVSELQKKNDAERPIPIKITRSVGLQVGFTCHPSLSKPPETPKPAPVTSTIVAKKPRQPKTAPVKSQPQNPPSAPPTPVGRLSVNQNLQKKTTPIPVPRIVAANKTPVKTAEKKIPIAMPSPAAPSSNVPTLKNALQNIPPGDNRKQTAEKRPAAFQSIDLTDDEPPPKLPDTRTFQSKVYNVQTPVRPQVRPNTVTKAVRPVNRIGFIGNILPNRPLFVPVNSPQQNNVAPMTMHNPRKIVPNTTRPFPRGLGTSQPIRMAPSSPIITSMVGVSHPAPLPETLILKPTSHPSWKWIPPRPKLDITKAENGIIVSWEMEGPVETHYEEVASYQIYAYQETNAPPSTELWKKIGDVKSLPLPMACTLTKFVTGYKYYFAVRAIDIRSRIGPFSAPGKILLANEK